MNSTFTSFSLFERVTHDNIVNEIFVHCNESELKVMSAVNKGMNALASDDKLWHALYPGAQAPEGQSLKNYCCKNILINSSDELYDRMNSFFNKMNNNEHGKFKCLFQRDENAIAEIKISSCREILFKMGKAHIKGLNKISQECIYVGTSSDTLTFQKGYTKNTLAARTVNHNCIISAQNNKNVVLDDTLIQKMTENKFSAIAENNNWKGLQRMSKEASFVSHSMLSVIKNKF